MDCYDDYIRPLAVDRKVSASTQNQALNALVFLYKHGLKTDLGEIQNLVRAKRPQRVPEVLSSAPQKFLTHPAEHRVSLTCR